MDGLSTDSHPTIVASLMNMSTLHDYVRQSGYVAVFAPVTAEGAGIPFPSETILLFAGFLAHEGVLDLRLVLIVGALGAVIGYGVGYGFGRTGGRQIMRRYGRFVLMNERRLDATERFFDGHGGKAVLLARWVPGVRTAGAWTAGTVRMPWWKFTLWNVVGGVIWSTVIVLVGYEVGQGFQQAAHWLGIGGAIVLAVIVLAAAATMLVRSHLRRR